MKTEKQRNFRSRHRPIHAEKVFHEKGILVLTRSLCCCRKMINVPGHNYFFCVKVIRENVMLGAQVS